MAGSTLAIRLEKVRFLVQELELLTSMCDASPTDETKRMLARRVLIRAADVVAHLQSLRSDLLAAGINYRDLKERRAAYEAELDAHYRTSRDRLSAHQQDLGLQDRIDLWEDIEAAKISYFVDGARELYEECLGSMGLPGFSAYSSPPEADDPAMLEAVATALHEPRAPGQFVVMAADPLAITRPRTVGMLNASPPHQRAGQLALLRRWIRMGAQLWIATREMPGCRRAVTAQLLTDIVSFADCLITRADASPKQTMEGLDRLLNSHDEGAFARFERTFRFAEVLDPIRDVRNKVGAHLETDPRTDLDAVHRRIDSVDLWRLMSFYQVLHALFRDVCGRVLYLRGYLLDDEPLIGVVDTTTPQRITGYHRE